MTTAMISEPGESVVTPGIRAIVPPRTTSRTRKSMTRVPDGCRSAPSVAMDWASALLRPWSNHCEDTGFQTRNRMATAIARPAKPGTC